MSNDLSEISSLLSDYRRFLEQKTTIKKIDEWYEITTPFLDRHNDHIQIYARRDDDNFRLSDDGYTIDDIELSGCALDTPNRKKLLEQTLKGFNVKLNKDNSLEVVASSERFPEAKHRLIQAVLAVGDLFLLASPTIAKVFVEDVANWLDEHEVRYTARVTFTGRTGYPQNFDFVIPKSKNSPERLLRAINHPTKENVSYAAFVWEDIKEQRPIDAVAYTILNDTDSKVSVNNMAALRAYGLIPRLWSERESFVQELLN